MMLAVIDTNILVSAFWLKIGSPAKILDLVLTGGLKPCFDSRILLEYKAVLTRPRFRFSIVEVNAVLQYIETVGLSVVPPPLGISFPDESDRKFYEVAKFCGAKLITGNQKHFPQAPDVLTVVDFLATLYG